MFDPQPTHVHGHLRLPSLPTIGGVREIDRLKLGIADASVGSRRVLLFAGEAGIGKTRLLSEAATLVVAEGGRFAIGRCVDETGVPPFLPWIDIGVQLAGMNSDDSSLPSIADLLLDQGESSTAGIGRNPESQRIRLYRIEESTR